MSRSRELIKNTGILFIAKASTQVISFLLLPLYTALLTTSEYGQLDIYSTLSMIIVPFATLQLEQGVFRYLISVKHKEQAEETISSTMAMIVLVIIAFTVGYAGANAIFHFKLAWILYLYYISLAFSSVMLQICRGFGKNGLFGIASFVISTITVGLNILFVAGLHLNVKGILYATIIANIIGSFYMLFATGTLRYIKFQKINKESSKELLGYSFPLVFNQISSWGINYSDRIVVLTFLGLGVNGIYSLANKFSNVLSTIFNVYNLAWTENIVRCLEDQSYKKYMRKIVVLTFKCYLTLVAGIINLLPFLFSHFVNKNYNAAYPHIPILLVGMCFSGMAATLGSIYIAHKKTKSVGITTLLSGITNLVLNLLLVKKIGLYAASLSTLVAFLALLIYRYIAMQSFEPLKINFTKILPEIAILIISWVAYMSENHIFIICGLALNLVNAGIFIKYNKKALLSMMKRDKGISEKRLHP